MFISPFASILHTNTVPSDKECATIRAFLTQPRYDAEKLDKEVARLQDLLSATLRTRDELRLAIGAHEALISPMRRAPDDVLRMIFIHSLPNDRNVALSGVEGPLLLGQICHRWRDIALTTPRLWATMHLVLPDDLSKLQILKEMVISWFGKSGAVPLGISMKFSRTRMSRSGTDRVQHALSVSGLLPAFMAVSRRWRSIQLIISRPEDLQLLADLTVEDVPHLQHMELSHDASAFWDSNNPNQQHIELRLLQASGLRSFAFWGAYHLLPANVPWANLRYLKLHTSSSQFSADLISFPFRFLEECRLLTTLDISVRYDISFSEPAGSGRGPIQLPHLSELALDMDLSGTTPRDPQLFDLLQTPALRSLHLTTYSYGQSPSALFRPIPFLQSFMMDLDRLPMVELGPVLDALPLVEELTFIGEPHLPSDQVDSVTHTHAVQSDGGFLEILIATHTTRRCPALRRLRIFRVSTVRDSGIVTFLKSRTGDGAVRNEVAQLMHFTCEVFRKKQIEVADEVRVEMRDGLELCLSYLPQEGIPKYSPLEGTGSVNDRDGPPHRFYIRPLSSPFE
ncbi:hypothetical protein C8F01DRAFT_509309 [Mycena amicta]|nr:hypothetical protein C8F01DRAFT_509309 [Mycena amicta]